MPRSINPLLAISLAFSCFLLFGIQFIYSKRKYKTDVWSLLILYDNLSSWTLNMLLRKIMPIKIFFYWQILQSSKSGVGFSLRNDNVLKIKTYLNSTCILPFVLNLQFNSKCPAVDCLNFCKIRQLLKKDLVKVNFIHFLRLSMTPHYITQQYTL